MNGFCECGCGRRTRLMMNAGEGYQKGDYRRFLRGHNATAHKKYQSREELLQAKRKNEQERWQRLKLDPVWKAKFYERRRRNKVPA